MTGTIYSGTYANGITLNDTAKQRTVTITGTVANLNNDAITGTVIFPWTVDNRGKITNSGTQGHALRLQQGGVVNNQLSTAMIAGYSEGVMIEGAYGTVTNLGTIENTATTGEAIELSHGGKITNGSASVPSALIHGASHAILIQGAPGTVTNFGQITNIAIDSNIRLESGGVVINGASNATTAQISGAGTAIYVANLAGRVANFGTISGLVRLQAGGTVSNGATNSVTASISVASGNAISVGGAAGTVINFGTVQTVGTTSPAIALIQGGRLTNGSTTITTALITSARSGVYISHQAGIITNFGTIATTTNSINLAQGGTVNNFGKLQSSSAPFSNVYIQGGGSLINGKNGARIGQIVGLGTGVAAFGGAISVTNSGTIASSAGSGIYSSSGGTITNLVGGLISGYSCGIYGRGTAISLTNSGAVGGTAVASEGAYLRGGGFILNKAGGLISGRSFGIKLGQQHNLTVVNSGTIIGAMGIGGGRSGDLTVINSGTIASNLGTAGTALILDNAFSRSELFVETGSKFIGIVNGGGNGEIFFDAGGTAVMTNVVAFATIGLKDGFSHSLTLTDANFAGNSPNRITVLGSNAGNTVNASALVTGRVTLIGGAGTDSFKGGGSGDIFQFSTTTLASPDTVAGNGGSDELVMTTAGTVAASKVTGVERFRLADGGANTLTLTTANFTGTSGGFIRIYGGDSGNTVTASGVTAAADQLVMYAGAGIDKFAGGAGNDVFVFSATELSASDTVVGGGGTDELLMLSSGAVTVTGVRGVEQIDLADDAANALMLTNGNFASVIGASIHVIGGSVGNTVDDSAVTGAQALAFTGSDGVDRVFLGAAAATITGGAGSNQFTFASVGTHTITDFAAGTSNRIIFRDSGFNLGLNEGNGTATQQHLSAAVFVSNATGAFTAPGQRFAYNTTNGTLRYDADGNGTAATASNVAVLTWHPALSASSLFFTS